MNATQLLYPVFVQVALVFVLLFWMGSVRFAAIKNREVKIKDIALGQRAWPDKCMQVSNTFQNQFELPILFYALVALAIQHARTVDTAMIALAWAFVITRLIHAFIYTTNNAIGWRFNVFLLGGLILLSMWILFAVRILAG